MLKESVHTVFVNEVLLLAVEEFWPIEGAKDASVWLFNFMSKFSFGKRERLTKRPQFERVMNRGRKQSIATFCTVFFLTNSLNSKRLGIIASKKTGNAVIRNQAKRKIREAFRHIKHRIEPAMDIVVISGRDLVSLPSSVLEKSIFQSFPVKR